MSRPLPVVLSFDVEVWCNGWRDLDQRFPTWYPRYVWGRSPRGDYALPKTLELLDRHDLRGVFFVEPLFAARFGIEYLTTIVSLIRAAGQEVQLHLHAEWTNEIRPPLFAGAERKRQHLIHFSLDEQRILLAAGCSLLEEAGAAPPTTFRAGSFAANRDTFRALADLGLRYDSSLNRVWAVSGPDLRGTVDFDRPDEIEGVRSLPVTVFADGLGRARPLQISACSFEEMRGVLEAAHAADSPGVVAVSHNFEMLKEDLSAPDWTVVRRFERLCRYLGEQRGRFVTTGFANIRPTAAPAPPLRVPQWTTWKRLAEQGLRRFA